MEDNYDKSIRISELIFLSVLGDINPEEREELNSLTGSQRETDRLIQMAVKNDPQDSGTEISAELRNKAFRTYNRKVNGKRQRTRALAWSLGAAAVAAAVLIISPFITTPGKNTLADNAPSAVKLILNTGEEIELENINESGIAAGGVRLDFSDGSLVIESEDATVSEHDAISYHTIKTPDRRIYTVTLPDGSEVVLNARTQLRFPTRFDEDSRTVYLDGEAYFSVVADARKPFEVKSDGFSTTVLGTEFSIRNYAGESYMATLVSGSVEVDNGAGRSVVLTPGQQAVADADGIDVGEVETIYYTSWKDGYFMFSQERISEIVKKVAEWYGFDYKIADRAKGDARITARMRIYENSDDMLQIMKDMKNIKIKDGTIVVE